MDTLDKIRKIKENPNEIFSYLKEIAKLNEICNAKGESLLAKQYEKINGIQSGTALEMYLNHNCEKKPMGSAQEIFMDYFKANS